MHSNCSQVTVDGRQVVDKIRKMGFNKSPISVALNINCSHCDTVFEMNRMETQCPGCRMVYGVTPCHSHSAEFVAPAGIDY